MSQRNCRIRKVFQLSLLILSLATPCLAQETPAWEFFGGYSVQRSNVREYFKSAPAIFSVRNQYATLNGWDLAVTENMNRWFGGTLDVSGHYKRPHLLGISNRERMHSILYGPRFSFRMPSLVPFTHLLFGITRANAAVTPTGPHISDTSFTVAAGGGVDLNLRGKASIRLLQAEYFHANSLGSNQNNYRAAAGVVFHLGKSQ